MSDEISLTIIKKCAKQYAKDIGLPIFGIASPEPLSSLYGLLEKRKQKKLESPFEKRWQAEVRCRPDLLLPSVKSIICVGMPYRAVSVRASSSLWGVSSHARGKDYHIVLKEKLELLASFLESFAGPWFEYKTAVDTVPLVERALAYRGGLGWYGKNNLLINPDYGSWFVLGELLTNMDLEPDIPLEESCGNCDICLRACPTGALSSPYQLDASKCVSCLTQTKGEIPVSLREKVGSSIFGCDICQEVCPQNQLTFSEVGMNECFVRNKGEDFPGEALIGLFSLTEEEFQQKYRETAFAWLGKERLQRNAILALGCHGGDKYISILEEVLKVGSPLVRSHAEWSLERIMKQLKT